MEIIGTLKKIGVKIKIQDIKDKYNDKKVNTIKNKFTLSHKNHITKFILKMKLFKICNKDYIIIPRFGAFNLLEDGIIDKIVNKIKPGEDINMEYIGTSNNNQKIIVKYLMDNIYNNENKLKGNSGCTLHMKTGLGKSYVALDMISKLNKKTLVIVPNSYLLSQWVQLLTQNFPNNTVGVYYGKKKVDGDIIVSIINSTIADEFVFITKIEKQKIITTLTPLEFYNQFGLVIFDESHTYCSNTFKQIYNRAQCEYMLGLTATPSERLDTFDDASHLNIGGVIDVEQIEGFEKNDVVFESTVHIVKYNGPDKYTTVTINPKNNMMETYKIIDNLIIDEFRNQLIINNILRLTKKNLNIFVFSERRDHLSTLYDLLDEQIDGEWNISIPELDIEKSMILYGGSTDDDIEKAKRFSNIVFTTYQYASVGISIVKMNSLILATPRKSNSTQINGRIYRLGKGEDIHRETVDIVDNKIPLKHQISSRMKTYKKNNSIIIKSEIKYEDIEIM